MTEKITKELLEKSLKEHDDFIKMVCLNKYGYDNREDIIKGVINYCNITDEKQKELINNCYFTPAGSILSKCNTETKGSFSNCYFTPIENDSIESIFECHKKLARTFSFRGGSGVSLTVLRPCNELVNNAAKKSSGAVSFMPLFSNTTKTIAQKGRRGALILLLDIRHPDSLKFIWSKAKPEEVFEVDIFTGNYPTIDGANISLQIPDSFMEAVKNNDDFTFYFPDIEYDKEKYNSEWDGDYEKWGESGGKFKYYNTMKAREVFKQIAEAAWMCGDPGIWFVDTAQRETFGTYINEKLKPTGVNPCFSEDTLIPTRNGAFPIKELVGKEVTVFDGDNWVKCDNFRKTGEDQELIEFVLSDGSSLKVTPYHNMYLNNGTKIKAKDLKVNDRLQYNATQLYNGDITEKSAYFKGFLAGDGTTTINGLTLLYLYNSKEICIEKLKSSLDESPIIKNNTNTITDINVVRQTKKRYSFSGITARDNGEFFRWASDYKHKIPSKAFSWDYKSKCEFIAGLFDADGSDLDNKNGYGYQITSIHKHFLIDLLSLLKSIGVYGRISLSRKGGYRDLPGGSYYCNPTYRLTVPQRYSIELSKQVKFERLKNFSDRSCSYSISYKYNKIVDIKMLSGKHDVYCCTLPTTNKILTSLGIITGQCGEQGLAPYNNCLLGAFVLTKYVDNGAFNWSKYSSDIRVATRLMNNFSDINQDKHPLQEQINNDIFGKRIGIEVTAFGDACALLGYRYGDDFSKTFANELSRKLLYESMDESCEIAKEKGSCKALESINDREQFINICGYCPDIVNELSPKILKYGLANTSFNTIGPCGSISIISGNTTSGIEPVFKFSYQRKNRIDNKEYSFIHLPAVEYMYNNLEEFEGLTLTEAKKKLNYVEADELNWKERIDVQASFQKYIDSSISSTLNLSSTCKIEEIIDIYLYAWEKGLKGVTVFRDGCKQGVLSGTETKEPYREQEIYEKELLDEEIAVRHRVMWKRSKLYVNVSTDEDNNPIELFTKLPKESGIDGDGKFSLPLFNERNSNWDLISRLISLCLRYGISLEHIIEQLEKSSYSIVDAASILKRILSKYKKCEDNEMMQECPECGSLSYILEGGCGKCNECGYTQCS